MAVAPNTRGLNIQPPFAQMTGRTATGYGGTRGFGTLGGTGYPRGFHPTKRYDDEGGGQGQGNPQPQQGTPATSVGYMSPYEQPLKKWGGLFADPNKLFSRFYRGPGDPTNERIDQIGQYLLSYGNRPYSPMARGALGSQGAGFSSPYDEMLKRLLSARAGGA